MVSKELNSPLSNKTLINRSEKLIKTKDEGIEKNNPIFIEKINSLENCFLSLIALDLDNEKYSTAIFNQWFPWSTYYMPNYTEETTPWKKRSRISFLKEDEPIRFNESIRNYTSAEFSDSDWNTINENWITSCDWHKFDRQQFYGLSLENVLAYGKPGTLNLWDRRKYTLAMPWNAEFKTRRLTLNFETKNT